MKSNNNLKNAINRFNWNRFARLWKNYSIENFWTDVCILFLPYVLYLYYVFGRGIEDVMELQVLQRGFFFAVCFIVFSAYSKFFFMPLKKKNEAALFWTLPASPLEKYLAGLSYSIIMGCVLSILTIVFGESTRILVHWLQGMSQEWLEFLPIRHDIIPFYFCFFVFGILSWVLSTFWLGGIYFVAYAYVKVALFHLAWVLVLHFLSVVWLPEGFFKNSLWENAGNSYALGFAFLCLAALNIWLAYRLFCKKEIVKTK